MKKKTKYYLILSILSFTLNISVSNGSSGLEPQSASHSRQASLSSPVNLDREDRNRIIDLTKKLEEIALHHPKGIEERDFERQIKPEDVHNLLRKLKLNESLGFDEIGAAAKYTFQQEKLTLAQDLNTLKNKLVDHTGDVRLVCLFPSLVSAIWSLTLMLPEGPYSRSDSLLTPASVHSSASVLFAKTLSADIKNYIENIPSLYLRLHSHALTFLSYYIEKFPPESLEGAASTKN